MTKRNICVVALIGAGLLAAAPVAQADPTDALLARVGKFQLDNGETKIVKRGSATKAYRVCMEEGRGAVPLKVIYEGKETIVEPGRVPVDRGHEDPAGQRRQAAERHDVDRQLRAPAGGKSYKTDVSVARTARNE